jgi:hypothetical protein
MATPVITTPEPSTLQTEVAEARSWLQKHERILIIFLAILAGVFLYNKVLDHEAAHDVLVAAQATQVLNQQEAKDATLAQAAAAQQQEYVALVQQLTQQNSALTAAMQNRTTVLQVQQKADAALPMPALGTRLGTLLGVGATDVVPTTSGLTLSPAASYRATESLEQLPVLTANLADSQTQNQNLTKELAAADDLSATKDEQITNLKQTVTDTQVAGDKNLAACKATARRGKLHSFFYGVGVGAGAVAAIVIHHIL